MKAITFLSFILIFSLPSMAQYRVTVETETRNMSKGPQFAFTVFIPESKSQEIEPVWKKYVNNRGLGERISNLATQIGNIFKSEEKQTSRDKLKVEKKGDEFYVRSIEEATITSHSMDVYARIVQLADGCQFSAFFQYTDSVFISDQNVDSERIENMKSYIRDFGVEAYKTVVDNQIKAAKKDVSSQEGILKDTESVTKKQEKAITRFESDIQEYNAGIFELENDIVRLNDTITAQKVMLATLMKKTPEYDVAKKQLKGLEREKSKLFSQVKSLKGKIKSKEQDIRSARDKITENEMKLVRQRQVIQEKELVVEKLNNKKNDIQ